MLNHCRPPPTVGEFFAGHPHWQTQPETVTVTNRRSSDYGRLGKKMDPARTLSPERGARARFYGRRPGAPSAAHAQVRARTTRERMYESLGLCHCFLFSGLVEYYFPREGSKYTHTHNTHTHTHTHTHTGTLDTGTGGYGIGSIICRFLESKMRYRWQRLHRLFYRFLE